MEILLEADNTHLYVGSRGKIAGTDLALSGSVRSVCRVAFADGSVALGSLIHAESGSWVLEVSPYKTAAGTDIPTKRWDITLQREGGNSIVFRIARRLAG